MSALRVMRLALLGLLLALALPGCTVIQAAQYATSRYCAIPGEVRTLNREAVAFAVAPHRISIQCAGGGYE